MSLISHLKKDEENNINVSTKEYIIRAKAIDFIFDK